jgi:DNA-binding transcriptional LysR family regulator
MNLNHLRVFAAVAKERSVTKAARSLKISQPAVSKQLAEFEQTLGTSLVDRLPKGVRLTEVGERLFGYAQTIFATESAAESELAALLGLAKGRLSIGASTTIGSYLLPNLLGEFHRRYPAIQLELEIGNSSTIQTSVLNNDLDIGFTEGFVSSERLEVEVFAQDEMVLIVAPGHPFVSQPCVYLQDLKLVPMLMREQGSGSRDIVTAALEQKGIHIDAAMSLGSTEALKNAVAAHLGVAIVSRLTIEQELKAGRLIAVEIENFSMHRALHLLRLRGKQPSSVTLGFISLLRSSTEVGSNWHAELKTYYEI